MISYRLDKTIDCGKLCEDIQRLINGHNILGHPQDQLLVISIKQIIDEQPNIPHIEYHPDCSS